MTPNETEKIKLMQLFRQGKIDNLPDVDSDEYKASKIKDMMSKANTNENNIEEMTRDQFERMDGLVDQSLLIKFLDTFEEIFSDYAEGGDEFFSDDVINYLSMMMQNRAQDARLDSQMSEKTIPGPKNPDGTPKSDAEMTDDEREDYYLNLDTVDETINENVDGGVEFFKRIAFKK